MVTVAQPTMPTREASSQFPRPHALHPAGDGPMMPNREDPAKEAHRIGPNWTNVVGRDRVKVPSLRFQPAEDHPGSFA